MARYGQSTAILSCVYWKLIAPKRGITGVREMNETLVMQLALSHVWSLLAPFLQA